MNYPWNKIITSEEKIHKEFTISVLFTNIVGGALAITGFIVFIEHALAGLIIFALDALLYWYLRVAKHYAFTDKRVILVDSFITKETNSIYYNQLTDIQVDQNGMERILGWGTISLNTAGTHSPVVKIWFIDNPEEVKKTLDTLYQSAKK